MSKPLVSEFVSLNGVMEAPGGEPTHPHAGWTFEFDNWPIAPLAARLTVEAAYAGGEAVSYQDASVSALRGRSARAN